VKKQIIAALLLLILILPMLAGIRRVRKLPRVAPPEDDDSSHPNG